MFSLIITIVSIALVVAVVAATMYHGGDTLTQGRAKADAAAFVSGAQQVSGAAVMYQSLESTAPADAATLVTSKYLSSLPAAKGGDFVLRAGGAGVDRAVTATVASTDVCEAINKSAGQTDAEATTTAAGAEALLADLPYGCVTDGADKRFVFKY